MTAPCTDPTTGRPHAVRTFWSLQCLRGVAALMVVIGHAQTTVLSHDWSPGFRRSTLLPWGAGVDLFFVISGFVMVHASGRLFGTVNGSPRFLSRRLARIVPLYWLATTAMLLLLAAGSLKGGDRFPAAGAIVASYAFVPFDTWGRNVLFPVLDLGWTLNYELFFYFVFATFVGLPRRRAVAGVALALTALVVAGSAIPPGTPLWFWSRPIILDFVLGMLIGLAVAEGWRLPAPVRAALALGGIVLFAVDPSALFAAPPGETVTNELPRVVWAGLPCAALISAATLGPEPPPPRTLRPLGALGDASYSLYLLHPFTLIALEKLMQKSAVMRHVPGEAIVAVAAGVAIMIALAAFRTIERPTTAWLTNRQGAGAPRSHAVPLRGDAA